MTEATATAAASGATWDWHGIDWAKAHRNVRRLQARIVKAVKAGRWRKVKALQRLLTRSFSGKALAVKRVTENQGSKTAGVDGTTWKTPTLKRSAILSLHRRGYQPQPLRRVYIPKANGKQRPLGIPTMKDRAMQALYWLALDPVAETLADPNSYGFRKGRSCADAAGQLFIQQSRKSSPQWVLDADISGCFDNISHEWLLANIPMDKAMLKKWLKAGYLEKQRLFPTATGTPQGGILSPTLANMTLDGLERCIEVGLQPVRKAMDGKPKVHLVRYADDFVITADQHWLAMKAKQEVEQFLQERGLKLSLEKTRCVSIGEGYDFLGWNFRKYEGTLLIKPAAKNVKHHLRKVRDIINGSGALSQETLIKRLNPMIRGWSNYHAGQASKETYGKLDHYLWKALWKWARRRHPSKGRRWIVKRHWHHEGNRNWVFGARTKDGERRFIKLHTYSETPIRRHIKIKGKANPYDPAWEEYFEQRETNAMKLTLTGRVKRLWTRQEGHCPNCQQLIKTDEEWAVHHKIPKSLGGRDTLENLQLLHGNCHRQVHAQHKLSELPAL